MTTGTAKTTGATLGQLTSTSTAAQPNIGAITDPTATRDATSADPNARAPVPVETSGGTAAPVSPGATGKDMPECMAAWDDKTQSARCAGGRFARDAQ